MDYREFRERYQYDPEKDLLGEGGFGRVFRAHDQLLDRQVALKIFSRDGRLQRYDLISEIRRAIALNHRNICRYYGAEVLRGSNALGEAQVIEVGVMEFVESGTLDVFLWKNPQYRKKLLADVLHGLSYLHQRQPPIIHRDLKPSNVLVGFDEDGVPVAKVTDFGISKSADGSGTDVSRVMGTYCYMAPEQFNPARYGVNGKIRCNVDLWAFGVMTIELLTGVLPFGAGDSDASTGQIIESIMRGVPAELLSGFDEPYRTVLQMCLVQNAGERAQSAEELLRVLDGPVREAPRGGRDTVAEEAWTPGPSGFARERTVAEGFAPQMPLDDGRSEATQASPSPGTMRPEAQPQRRRSSVKWVIGVIAACVLIAGGSAWYAVSRDPLPPGPGRINPKDGLKYVWIPPGSFQMGCSPGDTQCHDGEKPVHEVTISKGFWLGQTDVTQAAWKRVMNTDPSHFKGDELPVESVSWNDANEYCETVGGRLPTEAEWEYAARAGSTSARYGELDAIAWYQDNAGLKTHAVGGKLPNQFGLYDMLGDVWQWVADDYGPYSGGPRTDPFMKLDGAKKVERGGSWWDVPVYVRASYRNRREPTFRDEGLGFRCVGELSQ